MVAEVGGVFGTLTYRRLILPYLAYYDHMASNYGGPWCCPIPYTLVVQLEAFTGIIPEPPFYIKKMVGLPVLSVLTMVQQLTIQSRPHTIF
jgi:hypothetical protein